MFFHVYQIYTEVSIWSNILVTQLQSDQIYLLSYKFTKKKLKWESTGT